MHGSIAFFICSPFNMLINSTGTAFYVHTLFIYIIDFVHSLCIKNNTAANRNSTTLSTTTGAPCGNRNFVIIGNFKNCRNFLCILRSNNEVTLRHSEASVCPHSGKPEIVNTVGKFVNSSCRTILSAYCIL